MSKASYTLGPWKRRGGKEANTVLIEDGERGSVVAFMQGYGAELEANARLISAAPELLEACKKLRAIADGYRRGELQFGVMDIILEADTAIAKAT